MPRTFDELLEPMRARRAARQAESTGAVQPRGLLAGIGRVLDFPGRKVREFVTGREEATGRDVLQQLGLAGPNQAGLDVEDVLGFGAEVALDPLTYLGGLGTLTKTGKAASAIGKVEKSIDAASDAVRLGTTAVEKSRAQSLLDDLISRRQVLMSETSAAGAPATLAKGWRAQGEAGQRSLLKLGLPFTGLEANVATASPVLGALGKVGGALGGTAPIQGLRRLFDPKFGQAPELEALKEQFLGRGLREAQGDVLDTGRGFAKAQEGLGSYDDLVRGIEDPTQVLPGAEEFTQGFKGSLEELNRRELLSGAKGAEAQMEGYFPRVPTPQRRRELLKEGKAEGLLPPRVTARAGFQKARDEALRDMPTPDANKFLRGEGRPFDTFETNPTLAYAQRGARGETSIAAAKFLTATFDNFARPGQLDDVPLAQVAGPGGLRQWKGVPLPEGAENVQKALDAAGFGDLALPKSIAADVLQVYQKLQAPEEVEGLLRAFDKATAFYRTMFTVPFPAFHIRNFFSDTVMSWLNGGANPLKLGEAFQKALDPQWLREAENLGILRGSGTRWILDQASKGGGLKGPGAASKVAQFGENFSRTWHFLSKKAQGLSDLEAAASVKKALFDYSELTSAEKIIAKRLVLFYNWPRKVVPAILEKYVTEPGKMAALTRGATNPSVEKPPALPGFVQRGAAVPLGPTPDGGYSVLSGLGLPLEELSKLDPVSPEGGLLGALKQFMRRGGEMANPLLAGPAELALGRDFRTGRNIIEQDRADPLLGKIPGLSQLVGYKEETLPSGDIRPRGDPLALWALGRSPAARGLSTLAQGQELSQGGEDASLLRLLTGMQRFDLNKGDMLRAQEDALKSRAKGLQRSGELRSREILFAAGAEGEKSPEAVALVKKLREVEKARKAEAKRAAAPR